MCKIISISNQKGGVGKTTTSAALASGLKKKGFNVLAIDLDPQGNLAFSMGVDNTFCATIYDVLKGSVQIQHAVVKTEIVDVIPSNILLSGIELEFTNSGREYILKDKLVPLLPYYDYIIIDTPPALGILTVNAFTASTSILAPVNGDIFSLQGLRELFDAVKYVQKHCNPSLIFGGVVLTKFNPRARLSREVLGAVVLIAKDLDIPVFYTCIRCSVAITEAQSIQSDIVEYAKNTSGGKDYIQLVNEVLKRGL